MIGHINHKVFLLFAYGISVIQSGEELYVTPRALNFLEREVAIYSEVAHRLKEMVNLFSFLGESGPIRGIFQEK